MNITFLDFDDIKNPLLAGGQARATVEVGKRLVAKGHTLRVICSKYPGYQDRTENGIEYIHIGLGTNDIRVNNFAYIFSIPFAVRKIKDADIIVECFTAPMSTLCTPLFTRIPVVGLPTSFDANRFSHKYHLPFSFIERYGSKLYKYFMPYTNAYRDKMKQYNPNIESRVIPEGVGAEYFSIQPKKPKYILYLGRIDINQKGLDLLLESYHLAKNEITYPLIIAGRGPDESRLKKLISHYKLTGRVTFVGPAFGKKKEQLLSHALYAVMPSRNEGFSLFALEALASGVPILAFDIPGFTWSKGKGMIKAKPFDTRGYAKIMTKYCQPNAINPIKKIVKSEVKNFTWENVAMQFNEFFRYIIETEKRNKKL